MEGPSNPSNASAVAAPLPEKMDDCHFFYEDGVYRLTKQGNLQFGMVIENSEFVSSDEEEEEEEEEEENENVVGRRNKSKKKKKEVGLKKGFVRVAWHPKGMEEVIDEKKLHLTDRSLMPGDVVRRLIRGQNTQRGYCRNINVYSTVNIVGTHQFIVGINTKDLSPLTAVTPDVLVCLDSWIGMVREIKVKLTVRFPDGSLCVLDEYLADELEDLYERRDEESAYAQFDYYPGQLLGGTLAVFERGIWLEKKEDVTKCAEDKMKKGKKYWQVTVANTELVTLAVHWQCKAYTQDPAPADDLQQQTQPSPTVDGEALKRVKKLNVFEPCTHQIGDRSFYTLKENDIVMMRQEWKRLEKAQLAVVEGGALPSGAGQKQQRGIKRKNKKGRVQQLQRNEEKRAHAPLPAQSSQPTPPIETTEAPQPSQPMESTPAAGASATPPAPSTTKEDSDSFEDISSSDAEEQVDDALSTTSSATSSKARGGKSKPRPTTLHTGALKAKKLKKSRQQGSGQGIGQIMFAKPGDRVVVETVSTRSDIEVVWQNAEVENNISSRLLFPIHHLDEQEFFCGDFVVRGSDSDSDYDMHGYGVVQEVDHAGRTCRVRWFRTYTGGQECRPQDLGVTEEPVYDLKDHPDFKYRLGSIVIRVANLQDPGTSCGGQVLDLLTSGEVSVWWNNGVTSLCWPQDLYKIGEYDSDDEGGLWDDEEDEDGTGSDASWETESEHEVEAGEEEPSPATDPNLRPKLAANIEKARIAMTRLEEIFSDNPTLQTSCVMKQLLDVHRDCKYLDRLMGTSFFHESHFEGLLEKVKDRGRISSTQQAVNDHMNRLFKSPVTSPTSTLPLPPSITEEPPTVIDTKKAPPLAHASLATSDFLLPQPLKSSAKSSFDSSSKASSFDVHSSGVSPTTATREGDSGMETAEDTSEAFSVEHTVDGNRVCARLCALMKGQLVKAHEEVMTRYGGTAAAFTEEDLKESPGEADGDLESLMYQILSSTREKLNAQFRNITAAFGVSTDEEEKNEDQGKEGADEDIPRGVSTQDLAKALHGSSFSEESATAGASSSEPQPPSCSDVDGVFSLVEAAPTGHHFRLSLFQPVQPKTFIKFVRKEVNLLKTSLPSGIAVKAFEDRMDLYSVMIKGPERTPYEDGLFFFDMQLSTDYPKAPPKAHYHSYCVDRLNPNLYEDGKVCVSLLGTWSGKGTETWTPNSNMLQLLVSIQGLILVPEPYYNEAGYERHKGTQQGIENSRLYNEMVVVKLVQSMTQLAVRPPEVFKEEIKAHLNKNAKGFIARLNHWLEASASASASSPVTTEFPLVPASKGFCISLQKAIKNFEAALASINIFPNEEEEEEEKAKTKTCL